MKIKTNFIILIFLVLTLVPFIQSAPPVSEVQYFTEGYSILGSPQQNLKLGQNFQYNFFVYNISNGNQITNTTVRCFFYLADNFGEVKLFTPVRYFSDGHWGLDISGGNFSYIGHYNYGVKCNSTTKGGALVDYFEVTPSLEDNTTFFIILIFIALGLVLLGFIFENYIFAFLGGLSFLITGTYGMIYGYGLTTNLYTQMASYILIALGAIITILSGLDLLGSTEGKDWGEED